MATGTAFGFSSCLGRWEAAHGYVSAAGDATPGAIIAGITDRSGAGNHATLHTGKTGGRLSGFVGLNQGAGWSASSYMGYGAGNARSSGGRYAYIEFPGNDTTIYDIPAGAKPTGAVSGGSGNNLTVVSVTIRGYNAPLLVGGASPMSFGWVAGSASSGATCNWGSGYPGVAITLRKFTQSDIPCSVWPTIAVCRYQSSDNSTKLFVNNQFSCVASVTGNLFNVPISLDGGSAIAGYIGNIPSGSTAFQGAWIMSLMYDTALSDANIALLIRRIANYLGLPSNFGSNLFAPCGDSLWAGAWTGGAGTTGLDGPYLQGTSYVSGSSTSFAPNHEAPFYRLGELLGPTWKILGHAAVSGYTSSQANTATSGPVARAAQIVSSVTGTKLACVACGSNDLNTSVSLSTVQTNLSTSITTLSSAGYTVFGNTITHRGTTTSTVNTNIDSLNTWIRALGTTAGTIDWAAATDLETIGSANNYDGGTIRSDDGSVHTTPAGAARKAEIAYAAMKNKIYSDVYTSGLSASTMTTVVSPTTVSLAGAGTALASVQITTQTDSVCAHVSNTDSSALAVKFQMSADGTTYYDLVVKDRAILPRDFDCGGSYDDTNGIPASSACLFTIPIPRGINYIRIAQTSANASGTAVTKISY